MLFVETWPSDSLAIASFVDLRPDLIFLPWPFQVSSDSGKCFATEEASRPTQDA
jgi:hypothetical protein